MPVERISKTVNDVVTAVKRQFGDNSGVQVNNAYIFAWINDAQREIIKENPEIRQDLVLINVVAGTDTYPLLSNVPDMMIIHSLHYDGQILRNMSFVEAQEYIIKNDVPDGTPVIWYEYAGTITLWPKPDTSLTSGIKIFYSSSPADIDAVGDTLEVPDSYFNAVVIYCMWKAYEMDDNMASAEVMQKQFYDAVNRLGNRQRAQDNRYPTITLLPEDRYY